MKNLESYGVQKMSSRERVLTQGGASDPFDNFVGDQAAVDLGTFSSSSRHPLNEQYDANGGRSPLSPFGQWVADLVWNW